MAEIHLTNIAGVQINNGAEIQPNTETKTEEPGFFS